VSTFVDTNILVYAHDTDAGRRHEVASALVRQLWDARDGVLSTQVLQEFYVTITRKIPKPIARKDARDLVQTYTAWQVIGVEAVDILAASDYEERFRLSFWDALILISALKANADELVSEDLLAGRRIRGLQITNPFRE
jgi:predicted nucleic acid-binding protein